MHCPHHPHSGGINFGQGNKTRDLPRYGPDLKSISAVCRFSSTLSPAALSCSGRGGTSPPAALSCPFSFREQQPQQRSATLWRQRRKALLFSPPSLLLRISHPFRHPRRSYLASSVAREKATGINKTEEAVRVKGRCDYILQVGQCKA